MSDILTHIHSYKKEEVRHAIKATPPDRLAVAAKNAPPARGFVKALRTRAKAHHYAIIAEIKKASPSKGDIVDHCDASALARIAKDYAYGGATCLSVLTDTPSFKGHGQDLRIARDACDLPVLRKDFMVDPYQIMESRALGADCVLVILAMVADGLAGELLAESEKWGMDCLVEVHNEKELARALALQPHSRLLGINNRNLANFTTDITTTQKLAPLVPDSYFIVSESGFAQRQDIKQAQSFGAQGFLIGETLMRQKNKRAAVQNLLP